jgi:hypothetical protein
MGESAGSKIMASIVKEREAPAGPVPQGTLAPLDWLRRFGPSEALFPGDGWHSAVICPHVDIFLTILC